MGIVENDGRDHRSEFASLEAFMGLFNRELYIVSIRGTNGIPANLPKGGVLREICVRGTLNYVFDDLKKAEELGRVIYSSTGRTVGISKYDGSAPAALTHQNAVRAIKIAKINKEEVHIYDESKDSVRAELTVLVEE